VKSKNAVNVIRNIYSFLGLLIGPKSDILFVITAFCLLHKLIGAKGFWYFETGVTAWKKHVKLTATSAWQIHTTWASRTCSLTEKFSV